MTVEDLEDLEACFPEATHPDEVELYTDSVSVEEIHTRFGIERGTYGGFFTTTLSGDYGSTYGFEGSIPYLYKIVTKIN